MPRCRRVKSPDSVFHIMCRSVSDTRLFKNKDDKDKYLELVKKYQDIFGFKVYAYCLMDTHAHFIIDANGVDISSIMHRINFYYAQKYFNVKYKRRGHLFGDRFKSIVVNDDAYLVTLSAYIHRNPKVIKGFEKRVERYKYSSLGIYLGIHSDKLNLVDTSFILSQFSSDIFKARNLYLSFINSCKDKLTEAEIEFKNEKSEYRSERTILTRNFTPGEIIGAATKYLNNNPSDIHVKFKRGTSDFRAICVLLLQSLCGLSQKQVCSFIGNITISNVSTLSSKGARLIKENDAYKNIISDIVRTTRAS